MLLFNNAGALIAWAQTGYSTHRGIRVVGAPAVGFNNYTEVQGAAVLGAPGTYTRRWFAAPAAPGPNTYQAELNQANGDVNFSYRGLFIDRINEPQFQNLTFDQASYSGEIHDLQTPMVGTAAAPCNFTACQTRVAGGAGYAAVGLVAADRYTTGAEWQSRVVGPAAVNVWDTNP